MLLPPGSSSLEQRHSCLSAPAWPDHPANSPSSSSVSSSLPSDLVDWNLDMSTHKFKPVETITYRWKKKHAPLTSNAPPPAAATVAGEAPASRSWFCSEKSMLYHSAALSTGLGGITRLGFSRTSRTYRKGRRVKVCFLVLFHKCSRWKWEILHANIRLVLKLINSKPQELKRSTACAINSVASPVPLNQSKSGWPQAASRGGSYSAPASSACHT